MDILLVTILDSRYSNAESEDPSSNEMNVQ